MRYVIRDFKTKRVVGHAPSFEEGFDRCIDLYLRSDRSQSFFCAEAAAA